MERFAAASLTVWAGLKACATCDGKARATCDGKARTTCDGRTCTTSEGPSVAITTAARRHQRGPAVIVPCGAPVASQHTGQNPPRIPAFDFVQGIGNARLTTAAPAWSPAPARA